MRAISGHWSFIAWILLLVGSGQASGITYSAGIENSQWYNAGSIFECSLTHPIPGYGNAVFYQRAGESLSFHLDPEYNNMRPGRAALVIEAPAWRGGKPVTDLGFVDVSDNDDYPIRIPAPPAENMLASLQQGMAPTFTRRARFSDDPVRVRLTHVSFAREYQDFRRCVSGLLPVNFDQVKRTVVLFGLDERVLSEEDRRELDKVALYVQADDRVQALYVDGHTDRVGRRIYNRILSRDRAEAVTDYLVSQGVPAERISTRYHGDRFPVAGDNVPASRHRRATVRLERIGSETPPDPADDTTLTER